MSLPILDVLIFATIVATVYGLAINSNLYSTVTDDLSCSFNYESCQYSNLDMTFGSYYVACDSESEPLDCSLLSPIFNTSNDLCLNFGYVLNNFFHPVSLTVRLVSINGNTSVILFHDSTRGEGPRVHKIIKANITIRAVQEKSRLIFNCHRWPGTYQELDAVALYNFVASNGQC